MMWLATKIYEFWHSNCATTAQKRMIIDSRRHHLEKKEEDYINLLKVEKIKLDEFDEEVKEAAQIRERKETQIRERKETEMKERKTEGEGHVQFFIRKMTKSPKAEKRELP